MCLTDVEKVLRNMQVTSQDRTVPSNVQWERTDLCMHGFELVNPVTRHDNEYQPPWSRILRVDECPLQFLHQNTIDCVDVVSRWAL